MTRHKHYDALIAYANGAKIQFRNVDCDEWMDTHLPVFSPTGQYRAKPATLRYRLYLASLPFEYVNISCAYTDDEAERCESSSSFVRWLGDWQEVEV